MNTFSSAGRHRSPRNAPSRDRRAGSHTAGLPAPRTQNATVPDTAGSFSRVLCAALFALPVTAVLGVILLCITAGVAYSNPDPDALITPLSMGALGLTALLGGLVSARRGQTQPVLCGLFSGIMFMFLLFVISLLFGDDARAALTLGLSPMAGLGLRAGIVGLEILGALIGAHKPRQAGRAPGKHMRK